MLEVLAAAFYTVFIALLWKTHHRILYQLPHNAKLKIFVCFLNKQRLQNPEGGRKKKSQRNPNKQVNHFIYNSFPSLAPRNCSLSIQWLPFRLVAVSRFSTAQRQGMVHTTQRCLLVSVLEVLCIQFLPLLLCNGSKNWKANVQGIGYKISNLLFLLWCQTEIIPLSGRLKIAK